MQGFAVLWPFIKQNNLVLTTDGALYPYQVRFISLLASGLQSLLVLWPCRNGANFLVNSW